MLFGLLAIAVAGFSFDRLSTTSNAAPATVAASNVPAVLIHAAGQNLAGSIQRDLSRRLTDLAQAESKKRSVPAQSAADRWRGIASRMTNSQARFAAAHRLTATSNGGRGAAAVIDNVLIKIGDMVDGYKLSEVNASFVTFCGPYETFKLSFHSGR